MIKNIIKRSFNQTHITYPITALFENWVSCRKDGPL
nr:MAG TPA: hypothetical protein [Caudoviricetes sp.]